MPKKATKQSKFADKYGIKSYYVSDPGNLVCRKISVKTRMALKEDGIRVYHMPNGTFVVKVN